MIVAHGNSKNFLSIRLDFNCFLLTVKMRLLINCLYYSPDTHRQCRELKREFVWKHFCISSAGRSLDKIWDFFSYVVGNFSKLVNEILESNFLLYINVRTDCDFWQELDSTTMEIDNVIESEMLGESEQPEGGEESRKKLSFLFSVSFSRGRRIDRYAEAIMARVGLRLPSCETNTEGRSELEQPVRAYKEPRERFEHFRPRVQWRRKTRHDKLLRLVFNFLRTDASIDFGEPKICLSPNFACLDFCLPVWIKKLPFFGPDSVNPTFLQ